MQKTSGKELYLAPKINRYLEVFKPLLMTLWSNENVVLAGTLALQLHGLQMSRPAGDLDVVIFNPSDEQLRALNNFKFFELENRTFDSSEQQRSFKFKKEGLVIDFLVANVPVPMDLLYYEFAGIFWKIQNIKLNIEAKLSYQKEMGQMMIRSKDAADLLDLKNSNFNI